jgi:hypothetical protein
VKAAADVGMLGLLALLLLHLEGMCQLDTAAAYEVMQAWLSDDVTFAQPILFLLDAATACWDINTEQLASLLQLASRAGHLGSIAHLCRLPAAQQLQSDLVWQLGKQVAHGTTSISSFGALGVSESARVNAL